MEKKITLIFIIIVVLIIISLLCIYYIKSKQNNLDAKNIEKFPFQKFHKCNKYRVGRLLGEVLNENQIERGKLNDWDIYLPCGYNYVERELKSVIPKRASQIIFGINGCDFMVSKNKLWEHIVDYNGRDKASHIMPESWVINNPNDMKSFLKTYKRGEIYILKKNVQRKKGILLTQNLEEILKAKEENYKVIQKYMSDLYLINKRKVNLRIYLLIICKEGKVSAYLNEKGKCIYTNKDYNDNNLDFESNITSYHLDLSVYDQNPYSLEDLKNFMISRNENYYKLKRNIDKIVSNTVKSVEKSICKLKNLYYNKSFQLFGIDIIFTKDLKPYLLEMNKGPDMIPKNDIDRKLKLSVMNDIFQKLNVIKYPTNQKNGFYKIN